jgi:hypothetical protein
MRFKYLHITPEGSWQTNEDPTKEQLRDLCFEQIWADADGREPQRWIIFSYEGIFGYVVANPIIGFDGKVIHVMNMHAFPNIDSKGKE